MKKIAAVIAFSAWFVSVDGVYATHEEQGWQEGTPEIFKIATKGTPDELREFLPQWIEAGGDINERPGDDRGWWREGHSLLYMTVDRHFEACPGPPRPGWFDSYTTAEKVEQMEQQRASLVRGMENVKILMAYGADPDLDGHPEDYLNGDNGSPRDLFIVAKARLNALDERSMDCDEWIEYAEVLDSPEQYMNIALNGEQGGDQSEADESYSAVASTSGWAFAYAIGYSSKQEADDAALNECLSEGKGECTIVDRFEGPGCVALAYGSDDSGAWASVSGYSNNNRSTARNDALEECNSRGADCQITNIDCTEN